MGSEDLEGIPDAGRPVGKLEEEMIPGCADEGVLEFSHAAALMSDGGNDRDAQSIFQCGEVDVESLGLSFVDEVGGDDDRDEKRGGLEGGEEGALELRGLGHAENDIGTGLAPGSAKDIEGDLFIGGDGVEAVGAGEVDAEEIHAVMREAAFFAFDGDAGVVADALAVAGETVEERGFSRVRLTDEGDAQET
jgi:hypothetical protein